MAKTFDTRQEMAQALGISGIVAEIGVFRGDFAEDLLTLCPNITKLHLVDIWTPGQVYSGNQDGNNVEVYDGLDNYQYVQTRFVNNPRVSIHHMSSELFFPTLQDKSLDAVYIDSSHTYEGTKTELEFALAKVKPGGWIMGHDYMITNKCQHAWKFGVRDAVDEFMVRHNLKMEAIAMDGCASFAIQVPRIGIRGFTKIL